LVSQIAKPVTFSIHVRLYVLWANEPYNPLKQNGIHLDSWGINALTQWLAWEQWYLSTHLDITTSQTMYDLD
jgi:hypothetical protein